MQDLVDGEVAGRGISSIGSGMDIPPAPRTMTDELLMITEEQEEGDYVYDYFTYNMDELVYSDFPYMPDKRGVQQDSDHDSSDSNRESQDEKEYPDEDSSFDDEEPVRQQKIYEADIDDEDGVIREKRDSMDIDEEEAARKYNLK